LKGGEGGEKVRMGEVEGEGRATECAVAAPRGAFRVIQSDVGLAPPPLKLEHTQTCTRLLMTEGCFSQTEDHFPSPLSHSFISSLSHPFSPSLLALSLPPKFSPLLPPHPSPLLSPFPFTYRSSPFLPLLLCPSLLSS